MKDYLTIKTTYIESIDQLNNIVQTFMKCFASLWR